ncbi:hypothetical protein Hypma_009959 [Hypsizygus marmoreus]|uniref:Uncharacterized protein n=1 Tax=Hypsizygus marmoreus TaxID=39966 RepID=A0A369JML5_HYPMA|nr:hypothetical protein Hypma_009959 [Hypsizygus marmoreus]
METTLALRSLHVVSIPAPSVMVSDTHPLIDQPLDLVQNASISSLPWPICIGCAEESIDPVTAPSRVHLLLPACFLRGSPRVTLSFAVVGNYGLEQQAELVHQHLFPELIIESTSSSSSPPYFCHSPDTPDFAVKKKFIPAMQVVFSASISSTTHQRLNTASWLFHM